MTDTPGIQRLRRLVAKQNAATAAVDEVVAECLREGEFVEDIADALGRPREKVRRIRVALGLPDTREIRREKGLPLRRPEA